LALGGERHRELRLNRSDEVDARVLAIVRDLWKEADQPPTVGEIADGFGKKHPDETVTARWIGHVLRRKVGVVLVRNRHGYAVAESEWNKVQTLSVRIGLDPGG